MSAGVASAARVSHRFVTANGLRFHVAECGAGRRLALCLHGFPELWLSWRHQMPLLAELGYRVWAPDLRGYGGSDRPPRLQDYDIELLMTDVAALIDASGARTTVLIGHDWGGIIAWYVAMRRLRPLQRLVIMNAPHPGAAAPAFRSWKQLWRSWYAFFFQIPGLPERMLAARGGERIGRAIQRTACHPERFPDDVLAAYSENASTRESVRAMLNYYRAFLRSKGARRQRKLGTPIIDVPTYHRCPHPDVVGRGGRGADPSGKVLLTLSGHFHGGVDAFEEDRTWFSTSRAFCEPPHPYRIYDIDDRQVRQTEFTIDSPSPTQVLFLDFDLMDKITDDVESTGALQALRKEGWSLIGIASPGDRTPQVFEMANDALVERLGEVGCELDAVACRRGAKPSGSAPYRAAGQDLGVDLGTSRALVGSAKEARAARSVGIKTTSTKPDHVVGALRGLSSP